MKIISVITFLLFLMMSSVVFVINFFLLIIFVNIIDKIKKICYNYNVRKKRLL